jgi:plastocyanin
MTQRAAWTTLLALAAAAQLAPAGDITGTVTLKGAAPKEKDITPLMENADCKKFHSATPTTRFYVVGAKGELADVVVSIQGQSGKSTGAAAPPVVLDQKGCEYVPTILAAQTGQKIVVKNSDPLLHNVHAKPTADGNPEKNDAQLPGAGDLTYTFAKPEMWLKFQCDVHTWMFAWISVFDHPWFDVSAKDGTFKIANLPPGKYTIQAAHRKAGTTTQEIEVKDGAPTKVELTLEPK